MSTHQQITLLLDETSTWEKDFITKELIPKNTEILALDLRNVSKLCGRKSEDRVIIAFSSNSYGPHYIKSACSALLPDIIIHLSDEHYPGVKPEYNQLSAYTSLYLRQYNQPNYLYSSNTAFLGLGYGTGMLESFETSYSLQVKPIHTRMLPWAFVGTLKQDRAEMLESFRKIGAGHAETTGISINELRNIYADAIFAPVGRGNSTLDCFRIYETIILGCIPVVVGTRKMINDTLCHLGRPPYIFAESWQEAAEKCEVLLRDNEKLAILQRDCLRFWRTHILWVKDLCAFHLGCEYFNESSSSLAK